MRFTNRKYSNGLTAIIDSNPNVSLDQVLLHPEIGVTVRNEAESFLNYLKGEDPDHKQPRFHTLVKWALTLEYNTSPRFRLYQIHRNASNVLAHPSKRIHAIARDDPAQFLYRTLADFPFAVFPPEVLPVFAGHFERILECTFRQGGPGVDLILAKLLAILDKAIENPNVLTYQQLLTSFITEFSSVLESPLVGINSATLIEKVLDGAARATLRARMFLMGSESEWNAEFSLSSERAHDPFQRNRKRVRCLNCFGNEFPKPS
jgi:hypothetical protein